MTISVFKKYLQRMAVVALAAGLFVSCKKDKKDDVPEPGTGYPKEVNVTYKVTVASGAIPSCRFDYFNETGGMTIEQNVPVPITKTFKRTVNRLDYVGFTVASTAGGSLKLEILVNNTPVESQTFSGSGTFAGTVKYIFP
ncbi:hypothetical protein [Chitinophaga sp.]|uniref:hypothetical protein n=1 Tax=Chitinophaga sp. TaxID=1869181 RepID=UPI0031DE29A5